MEKVLKFIFVVVHLMALTIFVYLAYEYFAYDKDNLIAPIAIVISAILASTAMARNYIQNMKHEQQKINRELYDRRKNILFLLGKLLKKQIGSRNKPDTCSSIIKDAKFMKKCQKTYSEAKYLFDDIYFSLLEPIYENINNFINFADLLENIIVSDPNNKEDLIEEKLRKKENLEVTLLNSLYDNLGNVEKVLEIN